MAINLKEIFNSLSLVLTIYKSVKRMKDEKKKQKFLKALRDGDIDKLNIALLE